MFKRFKNNSVLDVSGTVGKVQRTSRELEKSFALKQYAIINTMIRNANESRNDGFASYLSGVNNDLRAEFQRGDYSLNGFSLNQIVKNYG